MNRKRKGIFIFLLLMVLGSIALINLPANVYAADEEFVNMHEKMWVDISPKDAFPAPRAIASDGATGNVYVVHYKIVGNSTYYSIKMISRDGITDLPFPDGVLKWSSYHNKEYTDWEPVAMVVDDIGRLLVASKNLVFVWTNETKTWECIQSLYGWPKAITVDKDLSIYIAYNEFTLRGARPGKIVKIPRKEAARDITGGQSLRELSSIAIDGTGNLYVIALGGSDEGVQVKKLSNGIWSNFNIEYLDWKGFPIAVAADNDDNLYFTVSGAKSDYRYSLFSDVYKWSKGGGNWTKITYNGGFYHPEGITVDSSGTVYVADTNNHMIKKLSDVAWIDFTGKSNIWNPCGIAMDSRTDSIYVVDTRNNKIKKQSKGTWTDITGNGKFWNPHGIAVDGSGNVYVADTWNNKIKKYSNGTWQDITGNADLWNPYGVAVDGSGKVYVTDSSHNKIKKLSNGIWTDISYDGNFWNPCGVAVDGSGNVYVADTWNNKIKKLSNNTWKDISYNGYFWNPESITVDGNGNVYVADTRNNSIKKLSGDYWTNISGNGSFWNPESIFASSSGNLYVADTWNNKVKKLLLFPYSSGEPMPPNNEFQPSVPIFSPMITPGGGTFTTPQSVMIEGALDGQSIYYTTDGGDPTQAGIIYTEPLSLAKSATVAAAVYDSDYGWSSVDNVRFDIIEQPVVSNNMITINLSNGLTQGGQPAVIDLFSLLPESVTLDSDTSATIHNTIDIAVGESIYLQIPAGTTVSSNTSQGALSIRQMSPETIRIPPPSNAEVFECSFGKADVEFSQPINISIPTTNPNAHAFYLDNGIWTDIGGAWSNNLLTFSVDHFGTFTTYDPPNGNIDFSPTDGSNLSVDSVLILNAPLGSSRILYYFSTGLPEVFDFTKANYISDSSGTISSVKAGYIVAKFLDSNGASSQMFNAHYTAYTNPVSEDNNDSDGKDNDDEHGNYGDNGIPTSTIGAVNNDYHSILTIPGRIDNNGKAVAMITQSQMRTAVSRAVAEASEQGADKIVITIEVDAPKAVEVETIIPGELMNQIIAGHAAELVIKSPFSTIKFDSAALSGILGKATGDLRIIAAKVDNSSLPPEAQQILSNRPVFSFKVTDEEKTISKFNGNITLAIPYELKAHEDSEAVVIYYINSEGQPEIIKNSIYNPLTGTAAFETTHFSLYAVGYNKVSFSDVSEAAWYSKAVKYLAARGITLGIGNGMYGPEFKLTRGEFLVMVMKGYGIEAETTADNFADAGDTYYTGYLAAARKNGITAGIGNNLYAPGRQITRQEMFTLAYNVLKAMKQLPETKKSDEVGPGRTLSEFTDEGQIASWAREAMSLLVETGTISGNAGKLAPQSTATRAEMAQVLYNLMVRISCH